MSTDLTLPPTSRRGFLGRAASAGAAAAFAATTGLAATGLAPSPLHAARSRPLPDDKWLEKLPGSQRAIFDMPFPAGGLPISHAAAFLDSHAQLYGMKHPDVSAAVSLYYMTTLLAYTDPIWAKYGVGELIDVGDAETGEPATRNVFWKPRGETLPVAGKIPLPSSVSISALQERGALFLLCNNAQTFFASMLAQRSGAAPAAVLAELEAHRIPGVVVVPAMVIAFSKAQQAGVTYQYLP